MYDSILNEDVRILLQLSIKLDNTLTSEHESLESEWYSLIQGNGGVQSCLCETANYI